MKEEGTGIKTEQTKSRKSGEFFNRTRAVFARLEHNLCTRFCVFKGVVVCEMDAKL